MTIADERSLLEKARKFDLDALGEIYDLFSPGLYRYAMRLLGEERLAEDCMADTFSRFLKAIRFGQGPKNHTKAYLYRIAHNWITDSYRKNSVILVELDESIIENKQKNPENQSAENSEKHELRLALRSLTPDQRQVITLRFLENWSIEEIANSIQKPVGAVKALQHRALRSLRTVLSFDEKVSQYELKK